MDFDAFERVIDYAMQRDPTRVLGYIVMPNHWHFVLWPRTDGELSRFLRRLTHTHTQRWHAHHGTAGTGHLYQGRFKSFAVEPDGPPMRAVLRYVERNALRAGLVDRAQHWKWCSLWRREHGDARARSLLHPWPVECPTDWVEWVNRPETPAELEALRRSLRRGCPYGSDLWQRQTVRRFGREFTLRPTHRPPRQPA